MQHTLLDATNEQRVPFQILDNGREFYFNTKLPADSQLRYLFLAICNIFAENKKEMIRKNCADGKVREGDFVKSFTKINSLKEKLFKSFLDLGISEHGWPKNASVSLEVPPEYYNEPEPMLFDQWKSLYKSSSRPGNASTLCPNLPQTSRSSLIKGPSSRRS